MGNFLFLSDLLTGHEPEQAGARTAVSARILFPLELADVAVRSPSGRLMGEDGTRGSSSLQGGFMESAAESFSLSPGESNG
jgi:hypothetical protein